MVIKINLLLCTSFCNLRFEHIINALCTNELKINFAPLKPQSSIFSSSTSIFNSLRLSLHYTQEKNNHSLSYYSLDVLVSRRAINLESAEWSSVYEKICVTVSYFYIKAMRSETTLLGNFETTRETVQMKVIWFWAQEAAR